MHDGRPHGASYSNVKSKLIKKSVHRPDMKKNEATGYLDADDKPGFKPGSTLRPALNRHPTGPLGNLKGQVHPMNP